MEYKRQLSYGALKYLCGDGKYIIDAIKSVRPKDEPWKLDIQIRRDDELNVYVGRTKILIIKIKTSENRIKFYADKAYHHGFLGEYAFGAKPGNEIVDYIEEAISRVNPSFYCKTVEGYYQSMMCYKYGEDSQNAFPFVIIDREAVIDCNNADLKKKFYSDIESKVASIISNLKKADIYGHIENGKYSAQKLDILAIDININLICIELKYITNKDLNEAPLQVKFYNEIFTELVSNNRNVFSDVREVILQKVSLGLLKKEILAIFKGKTCFNSIMSHIVIAGANKDNNCWAVYRQVINAGMGELNCKLFQLNEKEGLIEII